MNTSELSLRFKAHGLKVIPTYIEGVLIIEPKVFEDHRGYFYESFRADLLLAHGVPNHFVQGNQSLSGKNILRGLHFQVPPTAQAKLVSVIKGKVLDVAVDLRKGSKTYGKHVAIELSEENKKQLYIPTGFAHGFVTLENDTIFSYKCSEYYSKEHEACIQFNDTDLNINWNVTNPILSEKDKQGISFTDFKSPF